MFYVKQSQGHVPGFAAAWSCWRNSSAGSEIDHIDCPHFVQSYHLRVTYLYGSCLYTAHDCGQFFPLLYRADIK